MSFVIDNNNITNTTNKININDSIFVYPNKILETDKFVFKDSFTFEKNKPIPLAYIAHKSQSAAAIGSFKFDIKTGSIVSNNNVSMSAATPGYYANLAAILFDENVKCNYKLKWSCCSSNLSDTTEEKRLFLKFAPINVSLYTKDTIQTVIQPIADVSDYANANTTAEVVNNQISVYSSLTSQLYTILMVELL